MGIIRPSVFSHFQDTEESGESKVSIYFGEKVTVLTEIEPLSCGGPLLEGSDVRQERIPYLSLLG